MPPQDTLAQAAWPRPADADAASRLIDAVAALGPAGAGFAARPEQRRLLACLGGNAPYLADLAVREFTVLSQAVAQGPDKVLARVLRGLARLPASLSRPELMRRLRVAKRQAALVIALADIAGLWALPQVTGALSALADAALAAAIRHLLRALHGQKRIRLPDPKRPDEHCGFVALALGKLGAGELNYSSDIDLVLLYDPESPVYPGEAQATMARLARDLVALLSQRDADGYVFRVDLRLRPNPAATPAIVALPAALAYYEAQGRTWERAAFSKARPAAGDIGLGEHFLAAIRPFIWRRHLDFAAIDDIHEMKRRIDERSGPAPGGPAVADLAGFDVKLGQGGIREIEFIVQTLGLVWGGQEPGLRIPPTLSALPALSAAGHLPEPVAHSLAADYRQLRRIEHRLQMVADRQTHALPDTATALAAFATFMDEPDFYESLRGLLARVRGHFEGFFDAGADQGQKVGLDPGQAGAPPAAFTAHLRDLGFRDVGHIAERLRAWRDGGVPALRSERARALLPPILYNLLAALAAQPEPDRAFARFDSMIGRQRAGVQFFSLLQRNPALLDRLAAVLGAAPALSEHLAEDASALEPLIAPNARFSAPRPLLRRQLHHAETLEDAVAATRRFVRREDFHVSVATLEGLLDADAAGQARTALYEAALAALLPRVVTAHEARYGTVPGAAFAVVALGKAGGAEMMAGSDLDLMLIYDFEPAEIAPTAYFIRLANAFTGALTARGPEGQLAQVDMRLRPSGNQGPVAVSLASFRRYHATESWTWERLALTRARVLAATPGFAAPVEAAIAQALSREVPRATIVKDVRSMRARLGTEMPPKGPFDVKHRPGGMMALAFIPEALQLIHGPDDPSLFQPNTVAAIEALGRRGHLGATDAETLVAADRLWRTVQGIDRITGLADAAAAPAPSMLAPLLRATAEPDLAALLATMDATARFVRDCFERVLGG